MRKILLATAATACLALTACNPGGGSGSKPSATPMPTTPTPAGTPGGGSATPSSSGPGASQASLALGVPSRTVGTKLVGILEITPTTVVYTKEGDGTASRFGTFAVITTKDASLTANAADEEPAGANGTKGGWRWIAANGQSVAEGNGTAYKVLVTGYSGVGKIEPGTYQMRSEVFDLTPEQAEAGGTLVYTDATRSASRWTIPPTDSGPQVADVKKRLAS
ncbi:hypothetical protein [Streptomyces sp. HUAS TT7]|uniref:hypothetical protein n=1 Tax=Streptomyces sp. HUAS TT7 TaxID=3447507 RepID=UPI003F65EC3F